MNFLQPRLFNVFKSNSQVSIIKYIINIIKINCWIVFKFKAVNELFQTLKLPHTYLNNVKSFFLKV